MSIKCLQIRVLGKVQGVWFRGSTQQKALELGLNGFVQNEKDGSVYMEVMGEASVLEDFLEWCHQGPELAEVRELSINETGLKDFKGFRVLR